MFSSELPIITYRHTRGSKRALAWSMPFLLRSLLILSDGERSANDLSMLLGIQFERVADALRQLVDMALVEAVVVPPPPPAPVAPTLFTRPLPWYLKLFGGPHHDRSRATRPRRLHDAPLRRARAA
jgi:hypothetical protein